MTLSLRYAARSDVGLQRTGNEDSGFADAHLLIVADGMGGHAAGELASAMAVATFAEIARQDMSEDEVLEYLDEGVDLLTERIGDVIAEDPSNQGMGTTTTGMYWLGDRVGVVHVGDSRAYRLRDGELNQITKDHTYVQTLVDSGEITAEAAAVHPRRNLLIRAVDGIHPVEADLSMRETKPGDRYLLCSDGLTGVVSDDKLKDVLSNDADPTGAVSRLVDLALEGGAPDNVTVVVADVQETDGEIVAGLPVVVGAAGEPGNRAKLPNVPWPVDEQLDPDDPQPRTFEAGPDDDDGDNGGPGTEPLEAVSERRPAWFKWVLAGVAAIVVLFALVGAALLWWVQGQWYVGANESNNVTIYHGVQGTLGPIPLQVEDQVTELKVSSLPSFDQDSVNNGIETGSKSEAEDIVKKLNDAAGECVSDPSTPGCEDTNSTTSGDPSPEATVSTGPTTP